MWNQVKTPNLDPVIVSGGKTLYDWFGYCMAYVRASFGTRSADTALEGWQASKVRHEDRKLPKGVYVPIWFNHWGTYWGEYKNWGHVGIYKDGKVWTSPLTHKPTADVYSSISQVESKYNATFIGWSEDVCGDRVIEFKGDTPMTPKEEGNAYQIVLGRPMEHKGSGRTGYKFILDAKAEVEKQRKTHAKVVKIKDDEIKRLQTELATAGSDNVNLNALGAALRWLITRLGLKG